MMHTQTPDAGQEWNRFSRTGHPEDYLAYRRKKERPHHAKDLPPSPEAR